MPDFNFSYPPLPRQLVNAGLTFHTPKDWVCAPLGHINDVDPTEEHLQTAQQVSAGEVS